MIARPPAGNSQAPAGRAAVQLYAGPDLHYAAARSALPPHTGGALDGLHNVAGVLADVLRYRREDATGERRELVLASGKTAGDCQVTVVYAGNGANLDWCLSTVFTEFDVPASRTYSSQRELDRAFRDALDRVNIAFCESMRPADPEAARRLTFAVPAWVRQRLSIEPDWSTQVSRLRRNTRQEISRILRKYGYCCRLTQDDDDFLDFYEQSYRPHILRQHGPSALLVDQERFLRECRRGVLLQLVLDDKPIAGAVLRRVANSMAVLWTGTDDETSGNGPRGTTDALDYFSLLYAHLRGCRWLDFGRSRPDLRDGAFRYKRKWGAELTAGYVPQPVIRLGLGERHPDEFAYLGQHVFLTRTRRRFAANIFLKGTTDPASLDSIWRSIETPGISGYRFFVESPSSPAILEAIRDLDSRTTVMEVTSARAALDAAAQ